MIQANTNNRWARLSQSEKAELLGIYASKGYHDLANIIAHYNSCGGKKFEEGGDKDGSKKSGLIKRAIESIKDKVRRRLYDNIDPIGYNEFGDRLAKAITGDGEVIYHPYRDAVFAEYLGIPKEERHTFDNDELAEPVAVRDSEYAPTIGREEYRYRAVDFDDKMKFNLIYEALSSGKPSSVGISLSDAFGPHTIGVGADDKGQYVSYYDLWDINPTYGQNAAELNAESRLGKLIEKVVRKNADKDDVTNGIGNPLKFYDRIYLDDYFGVKQDTPPGPDSFNGGYIVPAFIEDSKYYDRPMTGNEYWELDKYIPIEEKANYSCGGKLFDGGGKFYKVPTPIVDGQNAGNYVDEQPNYSDGMFGGIDVGGFYDAMGRLRMPLPEVKAAKVEPIRVNTTPEWYNMVPLLYDVPSGFYSGINTDTDGGLFSEEAKARRKIKQRYAESKFNDRAESKAGARGAWQIMPITYKDYLGRGRGKEGDLYDAKFNEKIRDWVMGIIPKDLQEFWSDDDSDINKLAKLYAAYNWGAGSLRNFFRKRQNAGLSNDDPYEWVEGLNPETKRYVKYLAFDEDFDEDTGYTTKQFEDAAKARGYMAEGGRLFEMGGPGKTWQEAPLSYASENQLFRPLQSLRDPVGNDKFVYTFGNWLNNRRDILSKNMADTGMDSGGRRYFALPLYNTLGLSQEEKTVNDELESQLARVENAGYAEKLLPLFTHGQYNTKKNAVELSTVLGDRGNPKDVVALHEYGHALGQGSPQEEVIRRHFLGRPVRDKYLDDPSEIYTRLMTFRKLHNIDPNKVYTLDDIKELRGEAQKDFDEVITKPWTEHDKLQSEYAKKLADFLYPKLRDKVKDKWWWKRNGGAEGFYRSLKSDFIYARDLANQFGVEIPSEIQEIFDRSIKLINNDNSLQKVRYDEDNSFFKRMSDEDMLFLLNEVADSGNQESLHDNHLGNISANGGKINIKPENCFGNGGPGGWNIGATLLKRAKDKYLSDYAKRGYVYSYPQNVNELISYGLSPYIWTNDMTNYVHENNPKEVTDVRRALFAKNFDIDLSSVGLDGVIEESKYRPSVESNNKTKYYTVPGSATERFDKLNASMGHFKRDSGEDERGKYYSVYDIWDLSPFTESGNDFSLFGANPVEIYDRFYEDELPDEYIQYFNPENYKSATGYKGMSFKSGGSIHIKPEKRGTFTAAAKKHGKSVQAFAYQVLAHKENYSPSMVKKANFARNSKKWKHEDGGPINQYDEETEETGWLRRFLNTPTRVPNMTGTATAAATGLRDIPLTDSTVGRELAVAGTAMLPLAPYLGHSAAIGIDTMGRMAMPSTLLKGVSYYAPRAVGALAAASPWLDAGALSLWSAQAGKAAIDAGKEGRTGDAIGFGALSALPVVMPLTSRAASRLQKPFDRFRLSPSDIDLTALAPAETEAGVARLAPETETALRAAPTVRRAAAVGEWSPEELERLRAMAGDQPMDLAAYTPEQIAQAQAQMQADAPIIHDALAGNRSTAPTERFVASAPSVSSTTAGGYQIERYPGYMLKSLMEGNPLERQISKRGEVNVNNIRALMKKGSKMEQAVVDKVLSSEEFAGKKAINYNKFRKAVQDELITYERTPDIRYNNYGMDRLGINSYLDAAESPEMINKFNEFIKNNFAYDPDSELFFMPGDPSSEPLDPEDLAKMFFEDGPGFLDTPVGVTKKLDTFTFSSPRIPNGSAKHYSLNTLGHSRTYTTTDEPDVLHVMESQSDWAQGGIGRNKPDKLRLAEDIRDIEASLKKGEDIFTGDKLDEHARNVYKNVAEEKRRMLGESSMESLNSDYAQSIYNNDNYTSRQIQENLRYAAEKGQTKMRYPTRDTAAKIEGYTKSRSGVFELDPELRAKYDDFMASRQQKVNDIIREFAPEGYIDDYLQRWEEIPDEAIEVMDEAQRADLQRRSKLSWDFEKSDAGAEMKRKINEVYRKYDELKWLDENVPETYLPEHETILRKYDAFPKQYQKLYKGSDVRTITDSKGNTWYEVDVPEGYLQQEWAYKYGGPLQQYADFSGFF